MKFYKLLFLWFIVVQNSYAQDAVIQLNNTQDLLQIGQSLYFYEDTTAQLNLEKVQNKSFQKYDKNVFARPATRSAFWFRFTVQNNTSEDAWLEIGSLLAWHIDFYHPDNQYKKPILTGSLRADSTKLYDTNMFWLPLNQAGETNSKTYYIRITTEFPVEYPMYVGSLRALSKHKETNDFITAGFVGIMVIMFLYNGFLFLSTRNKLYITYLGYIFTSLFGFSFLNNYPLVYIFDFIPRVFWHQYFLVWMTLSNLFVGLFCIQYLDLKSRLPKIRLIILAFLFILLIVFPVLRIGGFPLIDLGNFQQLFVTLFYFTCLFTGYYLLYKKYAQARYYTLAWTSVQVSVFVFLAVINGGMEFNPFTRNATYYGLVLEVWLFSLALGDKINILRKKQLQTQAELLEQSNENQRLIEEQNATLEKRVLKRTQALQESREEVLVQNEELRQTQEELQAQRDFMDIQYTELQDINHQITASIRAAKEIQHAVLPQKEKMDFLLENYFILYCPKDVVSGDFYWINERKGEITLVVADCTGHGVPGAFMTLIGNDLLNKIIRIRKINTPADILTSLHFETNRMLTHEEVENNYGMDISIITFKRVDNEIFASYAGAKRDLYYILPNREELNIIKGTRKSIGGKQNERKQFENQNAVFPKDTLIYMGTDGLADQNNSERHKFTRKRIRNIFLENAQLPLIDQKEVLESTLNKHMENTDQRDDILWLGLKL